MREILLELSFFISIRYATGVTVTLNCIMTHKYFFFKPISNQLNILLGCTLSLTRYFNASYLEIDGLSSVDWTPSKNMTPFFQLLPYML